MPGKSNMSTAKRKEKAIRDTEKSVSKIRERMREMESMEFCIEESDETWTGDYERKYKQFDRLRRALKVRVKELAKYREEFEEIKREASELEQVRIENIPGLVVPDWLCQKLTELVNNTPDDRPSWHSKGFIRKYTPSYEEVLGLLQTGQEQTHCWDDIEGAARAVLDHVTKRVKGFRRMNLQSHLIHLEEIEREEPEEGVAGPSSVRKAPDGGQDPSSDDEKLFEKRLEDNSKLNDQDIDECNKRLTESVDMQKDEQDVDTEDADLTERDKDAGEDESSDDEEDADSKDGLSPIDAQHEDGEDQSSMTGNQSNCSNGTSQVAEEIISSDESSDESDSGSSSPEPAASTVDIPIRPVKAKKSIRPTPPVAEEPPKKVLKEEVITLD